jgi:hypothetical protein
VLEVSEPLCSHRPTHQPQLHLHELVVLCVHTLPPNVFVLPYSYTQCSSSRQMVYEAPLSLPSYSAIACPCAFVCTISLTRDSPCTVPHSIHCSSFTHPDSILVPSFLIARLALLRIASKVSINCSKPELKGGATGVIRAPTVLPDGAKCVLCREQVGFKPGLRAWDVSVGGRPFFLQCPPYPYCALHTVLIETRHTPQSITVQTLRDLASAATRLEGLCVCSNTDLPGTGASVLEHLHYQVVGKRFPVCDATATFSASPPQEEVRLSDGAAGASSGSSSGGTSSSSPSLSFAPPTVEFLNFPAAAVRVRGTSESAVLATAAALVDAWRSDEIAALIGADRASQTASFLCTRRSTVSAAGGGAVVGDDDKDCTGAESLLEMIVIPRTKGRGTRSTMQCIKSEWVGVLEMAG